MERDYVMFKKMAEQTIDLINTISSLKSSYYDVLLAVFTSRNYSDKEDDLSFINDSILQLGKIDIQLSCIREKIELRLNDELPFE